MSLLVEALDSGALTPATCPHAARVMMKAGVNVRQIPEMEVIRLIGFSSKERLEQNGRLN